MKASVALAYYNGGEYIREQLDSIRMQLEEEDEVIISVDAATDGSMEYLMQVSAKDPRIHILQGPGQGVVKNFEFAMLHCKGDIILLADQDDIWTKDKLSMIKKYFEKREITALLHNAELVDQEGQSLGQTMFDLRNSGRGILRNLLKNSYVGCCMAFRKELMPLICPIPSRMYMHDYWIGTIAELNGKVGFVKKPLLYYRRHGGNVTQMEHGSWKFMLTKRLNMLLCLVQLAGRMLRQKKATKV